TRGASREYKRFCYEAPNEDPVFFSRKPLFEQPRRGGVPFRPAAIVFSKADVSAPLDTRDYQRRGPDVAAPRRRCLDRGASDARKSACCRRRSSEVIRPPLSTRHTRPV